MSECITGSRTTASAHARSGRPRRHIRITARTALTALMTATLAACGGSKSETAEASAAPAAGATELTFRAEQVQHGGVRWAPVEMTTMAVAAELPGQLVPNADRTARLSAPAQGRLVTVHVQLGGRVSRGQPLVTLLSQDANAARADHAKAVAELTSRRAAANFARSAKERAERLLTAKAIARQEVERARADDELAQSALTQAQAEVYRAAAALTQLGVNSATGAMVLRSPLDGVVLSREAVPGSVVDAGTPLVTVSDVTTLWLEVAATERLAAALAPGARTRFIVPAVPTDTFEARVQSVGGALDPATRTLPVRALVQNRSRKLRPEMFATVWIDGGSPREGMAVPDSAIQLLDEKPVVFVARPDGKGGARFERRDVEIGGRLGGRTQVMRGLAAGDLVVVAGAFAVKATFARSKMPSEG